MVINDNDAFNTVCTVVLYQTKPLHTNGGRGKREVRKKMVYGDTGKGSTRYWKYVTTTGPGSADSQQ